MSQPLVDGGVGEVSITLPSERNQILNYIGSRDYVGVLN